MQVYDLNAATRPIRTSPPDRRRGLRRAAFTMKPVREPSRRIGRFVAMGVAVTATILVTVVLAVLDAPTVWRVTGYAVLVTLLTIGLARLVPGGSSAQ